VLLFPEPRRDDRRTAHYRLVVGVIAVADVLGGQRADQFTVELFHAVTYASSQRSTCVLSIRYLLGKPCLV
jgi:hypothetical protein